MRLTSLDCSYHPLHHGTSQAQRIEVGQPLDSRGPRVVSIDSLGPQVVLEDGAAYIWTPVGWGRMGLGAMAHLPPVAYAGESMGTATVSVTVPDGDYRRTVRTYEVDGSTTVLTYEETNDDAETDERQRAGGAGDGRDDDGGGAGAAEPGPSSDRGDVGASTESGPGALPGGAARPQARRRTR